MKLLGYKYTALEYEKRELYILKKMEEMKTDIYILIKSPKDINDSMKRLNTSTKWSFYFEQEFVFFFGEQKGHGDGIMSQIKGKEE